MCWNIGGLASDFTDPDFISYMGGFDVIALVETFLDKSFELINHFPDFEVFQASAVKLTHHGRSSGVVVLVKKRLMSFVYRIETTYDHIIYLKLSSTLLATHSDVLYSAAYVQPIMSPYYNASATLSIIGRTLTVAQGPRMTVQQMFLGGNFCPVSALNCTY